MIHADSGWPPARDEREPMCGTGRGAALTLPLVGGHGRCPTARGWGSGCRMLCDGGDRAAHPAVPHFPLCWERISGRVAQREWVWETLGAASPHSDCCRTGRSEPRRGSARCTAPWRRDAVGLAHSKAPTAAAAHRPSRHYPAFLPPPRITSTHSPQAGRGSPGRDFSQELGRSRTWLPRPPQLVAALRSHAPARTVPNSQLIHQLESPGGFPGSRPPGRGIRSARRGTAPPRPNRGAAFPYSATAERRPLGEQHGLCTGRPSSAGLPDRPGAAAPQGRVRDGSPGATPLRRRLRNPAAGQPGAAARRVPAHSEGTRGERSGG